ncbi:MAG: hypothetical protein P0S95_06550 [Rhabdochlamydiaceae bacterium]|nr:hypothetical protein [Candidatus Amphrikana amoebophyrae]
MKIHLNITIVVKVWDDACVIPTKTLRDLRIAKVIFHSPEYQEAIIQPEGKVLTIIAALPLEKESKFWPLLVASEGFK